MAALRVTELLQAGITRDGAVSLSLLGTDGKRYELELDLKCAPLTGMTILRTAGKIQTSRPQESQETQIVTGTSLQAAVLSTGNVGLVLALEGGAELVFSLPRGSLSQVAATLQEMLAADRQRN